MADEAKKQDIVADAGKFLSDVFGGAAKGVEENAKRLQEAVSNLWNAYGRIAEFAAQMKKDNWAGKISDFLKQAEDLTTRCERLKGKLDEFEKGLDKVDFEGLGQQISDATTALETLKLKETAPRVKDNLDTVLRAVETMKLTQTAPIVKARMDEVLRISGEITYKIGEVKQSVEIAKETLKLFPGQLKEDVKAVLEKMAPTALTAAEFLPGVGSTVKRLGGGKKAEAPAQPAKTPKPSDASSGALEKAAQAAERTEQAVRRMAQSMDQMAQRVNQRFANIEQRLDDMTRQMNEVGAAEVR